MRNIILIIVTTDSKMKNVVEQRGAQIIPENFRKNNGEMLNGVRFTVSCLAGGSTDYLTARIFEKVSNETSGVIVVAEKKLGIISQDISDIFFAVEYELNNSINSPLNFTNSLIRDVLHKYRELMTRFNDHKHRKIFTLPLRNFKAPELTQLREICGSSLSRRTFSAQIEDTLKKLRERQKPKRYDDYPHVYLVDDEDKHFSLGHEIHARADTAMPPHNNLCILRNTFRFGHRFDHERHYNVTADRKEERMIGSYTDCHGIPRPGLGKTHLNMFPNDFF